MGTNSETSKNATPETERSVVISDYLNLSVEIIESVYDLTKEAPTLKISGSVEEIMFALSAAYTALDKNCNFTAIYNELNRIHGDRSLLEKVPEVANDSDGMDVDMFDKFERVYSGHFHTRSTNGKIFYLGNPYEMFWNDVNDTRGFTIFDTQTLEHTPIDNPHRLFYNIYYDDTNYKLFNGTEYQDKIVKVIVKKKTNQKQFEKFIDKLYSASVRVHELKIVENFNIQDDEDFEVTETENTISILNRYIDEAEFDCDKSIIKGILQKIYAEACEVE